MISLTKEEWIESVKSVISGYESLIKLTEEEKGAVACVMECIEILFAAYFTGAKDTKHANDAYRVFQFIQNCENKKLSQWQKLVNEIYKYTFL